MASDWASSSHRPVDRDRASAAAMAAAPAPEQGAAASTGDRRTVITQVSGGGIEPLGASQTSRARGIGSRFRASNDVASKNHMGRAAAKETFK